MTKFEYNVEQLLNDTKMTKRQLAQELGLRPQNLNSALRSPRLDIILAIADIFGVSLDDLCR